MRANEFITESKAGKLSKRVQQASRGIDVYGDGERMSADYTAFKLGQAVAMADGSGSPLDIDAKSWYGKQKTAQPYSKVEQEMLKQAFKAVGAKYKDLNNGDMRSLELDSTNSKSPVIGFKGFK